MWIENTWLFPVLESVHLIGLALLVGNIVLGDLRVLGWSVAAQSSRLQNAGFWLMVLTGLPMFASGFERYRENPAFWVKIALLVVVLSIPKSTTRTRAWLSLGLWTLTVFAARAVIDFDV
ncbi:MAG: hypothetical protein ABIR70_20020 [Bryobacteraceae bacterium]